MKPTNLNFLFADQLPKFAHLLSSKPLSKADFLETVKANATGPAAPLFLAAAERSQFDTIRLSEGQDAILFNQ